MRVKQLTLQNIGPFIEAEMEFMTEADESPPVVLITGENGTGKSIILDAIRGMFGQYFARLDRDIRRRGKETASNIYLTLGNIDRLSGTYSVDKFTETYIQPTNIHLIGEIPKKVGQGEINSCPNWIVDYWSSGLAQDSYKINALESPDHKMFLTGALQGQRKKADITHLICHFDYLRDSRDRAEKALGERIYGILEQIIAESLLDGGKLSHVARATYEPIVVQNGQEVTLGQLSSGNSYLIQNMVSLLGKMYSSHFLRQAPLSELAQTPGLLLIDEAENQLHPKWQKRFIRSILDIFPNLQIIATTHSPFIISSVPNARLFVCKAKSDHCIVVDETAEYSNKPVDEILMSPLFEETQPFNAEITALIERRKAAINAGDETTRREIEARLQNLNPEYFAYFDVDRLLADMTEGEPET